MKSSVLVIVFAGCWRTSNPAPVANTAPPPPLAMEMAKPVAAARSIVRTAAGGVIELDGDRGPAMERAGSLMTEHCGIGQFTIVQEGEEAIGVEEAASKGVRPAVAWRVHYQCADD